MAVRDKWSDFEIWRRDEVIVCGFDKTIFRTFRRGCQWHNPQTAPWENRFYFVKSKSKALPYMNAYELLRMEVDRIKIVNSPQTADDPVALAFHFYLFV